MKRMSFAVAALVGFCTTSVRADTLPIIEGVPGTYTPGQSFTFNVLVPQLPSFSSYNLQLDFGTTVTNPALLSYPTVASPAPTGRYVFPSNAGFSFTFDSPLGATGVSLTLFDSTSPPVFTTVSGVNDTIAQITVAPEAALTGPITISVDGSSTFNYDNIEGPQYNPPPPIVVQQAGPSNPVPAPPGAVLLGIGGLLLGVRRLSVRRTS
jgi:hypothetical protein